MCGCNQTMPLSYVGDENFLGKKNKAKRQEKRTARRAKRATRKATRIEKRVDRKSTKLDRKLGKAATMRASGKPGKSLAGKVLRGAATVAMPGLMIPLSIANKQKQKREAAAQSQAENGIQNPITEVANLSTPLTPTTSAPAGGGEMEEPEGDLDQPTSGWDADAEAVSEAVNQAEAEGGYELGDYTQAAEGGYAEEEQEEVYEESFFGKASTSEQKKKNQRTILISLLSLVILCLLVWFVTRYLKK